MDGEKSLVVAEKSLVKPPAILANTAVKSSLPSYQSICLSCQNSLIQCFQHCLSKTESALPSSKQLVQEVLEMGKKRERTPPDFGPLLNSLEQEAERAKNRPLHGEEHIQVIPLQRKSFMKNEAMSPMVSSKLSANFPSADGEKTEGSLLKHQLNTHRLEINRLRAVLDEKAQTEAEEKAQIQTLKKSLQKSLEYALKASEWQEMESAGLKKIVSELKVEVSSLMAHLLMGEEEKQRMRTDYNRMKMQRDESEEKVRMLEFQMQILKDKLHQSNKDYLNINQNMEKVVKQAKEGSEEWTTKNEMMRRDMEKLSREYQTTFSSLKVAESRIVDLEFELKNICVQFNTTGEAKEKLESEKANLTTRLNQQTSDNHLLAAQITECRDHNRRLLGDLDQMTHMYTSTKADLERKLSILSTNFENLTEEKRIVDDSLAQLSILHQNMITELKATTFLRDDWERKYRELDAATKKEIDQLNSIINELRNQLVEEQTAAAKAKEVRQQLSLQIKELQVNLERENQENIALKTENSEMAQTLAVHSKLEEQVAKLESMKNNLLIEKRNLNEQLTSARTALVDKEEAFVSYRATMEGVKDALETELRAISEQMREKEAQMATLREEHNFFQILNKDTEEKKRMWEVEANEYKAKFSERQELFEVLAAEAKAAQSQTAQLMNIKANLESEIVVHRDTIQRLKNDAINSMNDNTKKLEAKEKIAEGLREKIRGLEGDLRQQAKTRLDLMRKIQQWIKEYIKIKEIVQAEYELRKKYQELANEAKQQIVPDVISRHEQQMVNSRADLDFSQKRNQVKVCMIQRLRILEDIDAELKSEKNRLGTVQKVLLDSLSEKIPPVTPNKPKTPKAEKVK